MLLHAITMASQQNSALFHSVKCCPVCGKAMYGAGSEQKYVITRTMKQRVIVVVGIVFSRGLYLQGEIN